MTQDNIYIFLIQLFLLLICARGLGEVFRRFRQPAITAEILVGVLLGPTVFGRFFPHIRQIVFPDDVLQQNMLATVAWLGLFFFLLEIGLEMDFSSAWRQRGNALKIAITDIVVPMSLGFVFCLFLPERYLPGPGLRVMFPLFLATAMTISAMPVAVRVLADLRISKTDLGLLIMSALSVNDILGWLVFTVVLGLFTQSGVPMFHLVGVIAITVGFTVVCLTLGRRFTSRVITWIKEKQMPEPGTSLTFICLLGIFCGAITHRIGIQALFGFFLAGIIAGEAPSFSEKTRQVISQMVYALFVPLFFVGIGLQIDFLKHFDWPLVLFVSLVGIAGKFSGAWLGARFCGLGQESRMPVAIAHTAGGGMEVVIGMLALQNHLISEAVFVAIVFGAIVSSVLVGPWMAYSLRKRREVGILEYFSRQAVAADLNAQGPDDAISKLCNLAVNQDDTLRYNAVYSAVAGREGTMGTALEWSIAVPHARLLALRRPIVVFGRSLAGIEWNSPDGKPTHFVFLILTSRYDEAIQVQILSLIARALAEQGVRDELAQAKDNLELWAVLQKTFTSGRIVRKPVRA